MLIEVQDNFTSNIQNFSPLQLTADLTPQNDDSREASSIISVFGDLEEASAKGDSDYDDWEYDFPKDSPQRQHMIDSGQDTCQHTSLFPRRSSNGQSSQSAQQKVLGTESTNDEPDQRDPEQPENIQGHKRKWLGRTFNRPTVPIYDVKRSKQDSSQ